MATLLNKVMNFVGWEGEDEEELEGDQSPEFKDAIRQPQFMQYGNGKKYAASKVVNMHSGGQMKVVIMQPENFEDAQEICDHLKNKKPVVINLETLGKDDAQRIIDFLSGSIYSLDGNIQKITNGIFIIAPFNVDIMGDFKEELRNKGVFPWVK